jgi:hypothetical protein
LPSPAAQKIRLSAKLGGPGPRFSGIYKAPRKLMLKPALWFDDNVSFLRVKLIYYTFNTV